MIRIGSDTDVGMNRNSSDWLGKNSYPILSPGYFKYYNNFIAIPLVNLRFSCRFWSSIYLILLPVLVQYRLLENSDFRQIFLFNDYFYICFCFFIFLFSRIVCQYWLSNGSVKNFCLNPVFFAKDKKSVRGCQNTKEFQEVRRSF